MRVVSAVDAAARRFRMSLPRGVVNDITSYMGVTAAEVRARQRSGECAASITAGPVAYLVEQPAHGWVAGHYHQVDQFQVFVRGNGTFGTRPLHGIHVHYAAAFTPYAPIAAGDGALAYFTLRRGFDPGAQWMPDSKDALRAQVRAPRADLGVVELRDPPLGATSCEAVFAPHDDGVGAWIYRLAADTRGQARPPGEGGGQFLLVLRGDCALDGTSAQMHAIGHVSADQAPVELVAGAQGAHVLLMQFGRGRAAQDAAQPKAPIE